VVATHGRFLAAGKNIARLKKQFFISCMGKLRGSNKSMVNSENKSNNNKNSGRKSSRNSKAKHLSSQVGNEVTTLNQRVLVIGATSPVGGNVTSMLLDQLVKEVNIGQVPLKGGKVSHFLKLGAILREYDFEKPETVEELYNNIDVVCLTIDIDPKVSSTIDQFIEPLHKYIDTIKLLVVSIRGGNFIELKDTQLSKMMLANEEKKSKV